MQPSPQIDFVTASRSRDGRDRSLRLASRQSQGFTLVEILVVIVIIGLVAGAITIAVSVLGRDREVEDQAKRLGAILTQVQEESELLGRNIGLIVDQTGYQFVQFDARKWEWVPVVEDDLLSARQLPPGLFISLSLEGRPVVLKPHSEYEEAAGKKSDEEQDEAKESAPMPKSLQEARLAPHIMLLASGDVNSFDLQIERDGEPYRWHVNSMPDNKIEAGEVDAAL